LDPETRDFKSQDGGWVLWRFARATWRHFRESWCDVPRVARRRYFLTLAAGFLPCAAFVAAMTLVARARINDGLQQWDERWLLAVERNRVMSFSDAILVESFGNLAYMVPLTAGAMIVSARAARPLLALSFPLAYVLCRPLVLLGWWIWQRPRPTLIAGGIAAPGLHSFPSGHVALMVSVYGLLTYLWWRATRSSAERAFAVALLVALLGVTGFARVRLGSHWPSDILSGYAVGLAWVAAVILALRRAEKAGGH
jgi:membrane-associated phospholipid phosphatase